MKIKAALRSSISPQSEWPSSRKQMSTSAGEEPSLLKGVQTGAVNMKDNAGVSQTTKNVSTIRSS